ncbi:MAG: hypothetical protein RLZZ210_232 [Pseudomonadota bacterium]|jgi:amino acid transporter
MKQFLKTIKAVLWSFIGIRKNSNHEEDTKLNPIHIVIVAIILTILFIYTLLAIVSHAIKG